MIIFGIDPGTLLTGYGVLECVGTTAKVLDYGAIHPPSNRKLTDRYLIIYNAISQLLDKFCPEAFAIETQYIKHNPQTAIKLGMARGISLIAAKQRGIPVYEYTPSRAKLAVTGHGNASKSQVQGMMQSLLHLKEPPQPEDAADALALAYCHWNTLCSQTLSLQEI